VRAKAVEALCPTQIGYTWQYDVVLTPTDDTLAETPGTFTSMIQAVKQVDGKTFIEMREEDSYVYGYRFPVLEINEKSLTLKGVTYLGPLSSTVDGHTIDFLHLPLQAGAKWDDGQWISKVKGKEGISVPAGSYDAWKIEVIGVFDHAYTTVGDYWIAPGAGIVKADLALDGYRAEYSLRTAGINAKRK
jgi:hypothetical protein